MLYRPGISVHLQAAGRVTRPRDRCGVAQDNACAARHLSEQSRDTPAAPDYSPSFPCSGCASAAPFRQCTHMVRSVCARARRNRLRPSRGRPWASSERAASVGSRWRALCTAEQIEAGMIDRRHLRGGGLLREEAEETRGFGGGFGGGRRGLGRGRGLRRCRRRCARLSAIRALALASTARVADSAIAPIRVPFWFRSSVTRVL